MTPEVTVILPVYNGANYLRQSIDSVLSQTYKDFSLHILDDASDDDTPRIAQSVNDPRIKYSKNSGRFGLFKTLNRGFEESTSPLIRIWAHDDRMLPNCLESFVNFSRKHPDAGMAYCDFFAINAEGTQTGAEEQYRDQRDRTPDVANSSVSALLFFYYGCLPGNISTVMITRAAWKEMGGFLEGLQQAPDYDMWTRISERYPIGFLRDKLIELRDHSLQLNRLGSKDMTAIEEEFNVIQHLRHRLGNIVPPCEFDYYWRHQRGRQHVHWLVRALLKGDFKNVTRGWRAIRRYGQPWSQALSWLITINGRIFMPKRTTIVDRRLEVLRNG